MLLNQLSESGKVLFFKFATKIINADGEFSDDEKRMIESYKEEIQKDINIEDFKNEILDDCIEQIGKLDNNEKKIVFFELLGLAVCDSFFSKEENDVIDKLRNALHIDMQMQEEMISSIKTLAETYKKINTFLS